MHRLEFLRSRGFHLCMTIAWALMSIPTALWWNNSVLWVGEMSVYACMTTHWGSYQGARAEHTAGSGGDGTEDGTGGGEADARHLDLTPGPGGRPGPPGNDPVKSRRDCAGFSA